MLLQRGLSCTVTSAGSHLSAPRSVNDSLLPGSSNPPAPPSRLHSRARARLQSTPLPPRARPRQPENRSASLMPANFELRGIKCVEREVCAGMAEGGLIKRARNDELIFFVHDLLGERLNFDFI